MALTRNENQSHRPDSAGQNDSNRGVDWLKTPHHAGLLYEVKYPAFGAMRSSMARIIVPPNGWNAWAIRALSSTWSGLGHPWDGRRAGVLTAANRAEDSHESDPRGVGRPHQPPGQ
jgi:hypothetical protein